MNHIPTPPGGGSWRWTGAEWAPNAPPPDENITAEIDGTMPAGPLLDPDPEVQTSAQALPAAK